MKEKVDLVALKWSFYDVTSKTGSGRTDRTPKSHLSTLNHGSREKYTVVGTWKENAKEKILSDFDNHLFIYLFIFFCFTDDDSFGSSITYALKRRY